MNSLSQNPQPLTIGLNNTILSDQVEGFVLCSCDDGQYRAGADCLDCPKGCVNCELEGSLLWDEVANFWV